MKHRTLLATICVLGGACASCININIYFPETELREAAEEIVNEVRPETASTSSNSGPSGEGAEKKPAAPLPNGSQERTTSGGIFSIFRLSEAHADEKKDSKDIRLDVSSPVIKKIKETIKARYEKLLTFYKKGAIGEGIDGYLALRDTEVLGLKEKRDVQALLKEENEDRKNLYTEISRANGIDDSLIPDVGKLFSAEWQKKSKTGWWVESEKGKWEKKPAEKKK